MAIMPNPKRSKVPIIYVLLFLLQRLPVSWSTVFGSVTHGLQTSDLVVYPLGIGGERFIQHRQTPVRYIWAY
jgi:hypothetical protein